jgi:hypothetical protein
MGGRITAEDGGGKGQRDKNRWGEHTSVVYDSFPTLGLTNNAQLVISFRKQPSWHMRKTPEANWLT